MDINPKTIETAHRVAARGVEEGHNWQAAALLIVADEIRRLREVIEKSTEVQR